MTELAKVRQIPFGRPMIGAEERAAVAEVLSGTRLVHGPRTDEFEAAFQTFVGAGHAVAVSSCTAALHLYYFQAGIGPGDEVIVPAQTHTATAHAVELVGATPVFVDSEPTTGNVDLDQVESAIGPSTRAISIVHYLGVPVDMARLGAIASAHGLEIVEDCALAVGARFQGQHVGLAGTGGCFSFYPVKHFTTAEGGMFITDDENLARRFRHLRAFGVDRHFGERAVPGVYDVTALGFNYRLNEIQAAIGVEQVKKLPAFLRTRRDNFEVLSAGLRQIDELRILEAEITPDQEPSYYCLSAVLDRTTASRRTDIVAGLNAAGIGSSVYYPRPVPLMSYYQDKYGTASDAFPVAAEISEQSIALPVGPHLDADDMHYIVSSMKQVIQTMGGS